MIKSIKFGTVVVGAFSMIVGGYKLVKYLFSDDTDESNSNILPKELILKVMKDLRSQLFSILIEIVQIREKVLAENFKDIPPSKEQQKEVIQTLQDEMIKIVKKKENIICIKYEITPDILSDHINKYYIKDNDIQKIVTQIAQSIDNALNGIGPSLELKQEVIEKLPKSKVLYLIDQIIRQSGKIFIECHRQMNEEGEHKFTMENPNYLKKIRSLNLAEKKRNFLLQNGFDQFDESPTEVLGKISQRYKNDDKRFSEKISKLDQQYQQLMMKLLEQSTADQSYLEQIFGPELTEKDYENLLQE